MTQVNLYPLNDFSIQVKLYTIDANPASLTFGKSIPLTQASVTHFLAQSDSPTATAADPSLTGTATYVGTLASPGWWLVQLAGAVLDPTLLATKFASTPPFLIVVQSGSHLRTVVPLVYTPSNYAQVP